MPGGNETDATALLDLYLTNAETNAQSLRSVH
jgi:hypothetical protein